jgi:pimeloyl-ACP methyl ester carboxylesterase
MSALTIQDELVHYEVLGRGRALILVHGWLGSWRYWISSMQQLSISDYRTYALDLWGFGDTSKIPDRYTFESQVQLLYEFMDSLGILKAALVGHALGAAVALRLAELHPDRVVRIMVTSLPMVGDWELSSRITGTPPAAWVERLVGRDRADFEATKAEASRADIKALEMSVNDLSHIDWRPTLSGIHIPTIITHGEDDPLIPLPDERWLADLDFNRNVHRVLFNESRHFPMLDEPAAFNRLLLEFLNTEDISALKIKELWQRRIR